MTFTYSGSRYSQSIVMSQDLDFAIALSLQEQFDRETKSGHLNRKPQPSLSWYHEASVPQSTATGEYDPRKIVDSSWELTDPNPNIHDLFVRFDHMFFEGTLVSRGVVVSWSNRMTLCAGVCSYRGREGFCSIRLSQPLLKLRPRRDLVQTLLHEMIHAFLFVTHNNEDHDGHGPNFQAHMHKINNLTGARITIFHSFHDEVREYRQHWWRCNGPCQKRPPYYGMVKRAINRAPSPRDPWWAKHRESCDGTYVKVKEPENYKKKGQPKEKGHVLGGEIKFFAANGKNRKKDGRSRTPVIDLDKNRKIDEIFPKIGTKKISVVPIDDASESRRSKDSMRSKMLAAAERRLRESERQTKRTEKRVSSYISEDFTGSKAKKLKLKQSSPGPSHSTPTMIDLCDDTNYHPLSQSSQSSNVEAGRKDTVARSETSAEVNKEVLVIDVPAISEPKSELDNEMVRTATGLDDGVVALSDTTVTGLDDGVVALSDTTVTGLDDGVVALSDTTVTGLDDEVVIIDGEEFKTCPVCGMTGIPAVIINAHIAFCLDEEDSSDDD